MPILCQETKFEMFNVAEDICSMTEFKRRTANVVNRLRDTGRAVILTTNGKADVVVQDAASYQRLLERLNASEKQTRSAGGVQ
jgi:prevent-host-death family protein